MNYAIEVLEKEKRLLEICLSEWDLNNYPEAKKERAEKLKDIILSINSLKTKKHIIQNPKNNILCECGLNERCSFDCVSIDCRFPKNN